MRVFWGRVSLRRWLGIGLVVLVVLSLTIVPARAEKLYVVERDRGKLSVIRNGEHVGQIDDLGNLKHATFQMHDGYGYVLSRDGQLSKIDPGSDEIVAQADVGESSIGLAFGSGRLAVANYEPSTVEFLNFDLESVHSLETGSRNVGIQYHEGTFYFSLMDSDAIWRVNPSEGFKVLQRYRNVGTMPFDSFITGNSYLVGFYKDDHLGRIDLKTNEYEQVEVKRRDSGEPVFKVPHFGFWGVHGDEVYVPSAKDKKLYEFDLDNREITNTVDLPGQPVFAVLSPDRSELAVNYSGDQDHQITLIDRESMTVKKTVPAGDKILHMRYSSDGRTLYVSSNFDNRLRTYDRAKGRWVNEVSVASPSGIFPVTE